MIPKALFSYFFIFLWLVAPKANSQNFDQKKWVEENNKLGEKLMNEQNVDSALFYLEQNLVDSLLHNKELAIQVLKSYKLAVSLKATLTNYTEVISLAKRGLKTPEHLLPKSTETVFVRMIAKGYYHLGKPNESIKWSKRLLKLAPDLKEKHVSGDPGATAQLFNGYQLLGLNNQSLGNHDRAIKNFKFSEKYLAKDFIEGKMVLNNNLARNFKATGYFDSASHYFNLGAKYLALFDPPLKITKLKYQVTHNSNMSHFSLVLRDTVKALNYARRAYELGKEVYEKTSMMSVSLGSKYALMLGKKHRYEEAENLLLEIVDQVRQSPLAKYRVFQTTRSYLAETYYNHKSYQKAIDLYQELLEDREKVHIGEYWVYVNIIDVCYDMVYLLKSADHLLNIREKTYAQIYQDMVVISEFNAQYMGGSRSTYNIRVVLQSLIDYYSKEYENKPLPATAEKIWNLVEMSRSRLLLDNRNFNKQINLISGELKQSEINLRDSIQLVMNSRGKTAANKDSLLLVLNKSYDVLKNKIRSEYPDYFQLKYETNLITLKEAQNCLENSTSILSFLHDRKKLYMINLSKNDFKIHYTDQWEDESTKYLDEIVTSSLDKECKNILVIPDGAVWNVDFDILPARNQSKKYLIEELSISYDHSVSSLVNRENENNTSSAKVLALAYGDESTQKFSNVPLSIFRDVSLNELPGSLYEIKQIAEIMEGEFLVGSVSSESQFKQKSNEYDILHLAIHGELNDEQPELSKLVFFNNGDTIEDGNLHAYELYNMKLNAKFAVLSACNTGTGNLKTGMGAMSLGRAFSFAGVPSLMLTRSEVSDISTPYIIKYFYEGLNKELTKSEALRQAKLKYLRVNADNITSAPIFWSSFYILGDDSPIVNKTNYNKFYLLGALSILVFLLFWITIKRKNRPRVSG